MSITVYSKPACVKCNATYRALDKKDLVFETVDFSQDIDAYDLIKGLGHMEAPVVVQRNEEGEILDHWSGFEPEKIEDLA